MKNVVELNFSVTYGRDTKTNTDYYLIVPKYNEDVTCSHYICLCEYLMGNIAKTFKRDHPELPGDHFENVVEGMKERGRIIHNNMLNKDKEIQ